MGSAVRRPVALLLGCAVFTAGGLWMIREERSPMSFAVTATFGLGLLVALVMLDQRIRMVRAASAVGEAAILGGVRIPLRRGRFRFLGVLLVGVGAVGITASPVAGVIFGLANVFVVGAGVALIGGWLPRGRDEWLSFDPAGVTFGGGRGRPARFVAWDEVRAVVPYVIADNPVLTVVLTTGRVDLAPWAYGLDAVWLARAMARYAADPSARRELEPVAALSG